MKNEKQTFSEKMLRYLIFLVGLFVNSFGVSFVTKASLGTSPISSIPYVLSLKFPLSLGVFTILFSCLLIVLQIILLGKKFKPENLLQFPVSIIFGVFIDFTMGMLTALNPETFVMKTLSLLLGCLILGFGVYIEVLADVVMLPGESFVRAVTLRFKTEFGTTKVCFDASLTIIAAVLSFLFMRRLNGVGLGTIIAALIVGFIAKWFGTTLHALPEKIFASARAKADAIEAVVDDANHLVVTIARDYGCYGDVVAEKLAERLGVAYYPDDIKTFVEEEIEAERVVDSLSTPYSNRGMLLDMIAQANAYAEIQKDREENIKEKNGKLLREYAAKSSCVILGKLGNFVLEGRPNTVSIYLTGNKENRIWRVMETEKLNRDQALDKIRQSEKARRNHCFAATGKMIDSAKYYDLSINVSEFGVDRTVETIANLIENM